MIQWPDIWFNPINLWSAPKMEDTKGYFDTDPEDCDACGCPAHDFGEEDYDSGTWKCPECGEVQ